MSTISMIFNARWLERFRAAFTPRDVYFHDGRELRRFRLGTRVQAALASLAAITLIFSGYGVAQAARGAAEMSGILQSAAPTAKLARMRTRLVAMQANVTEIKNAATAHAKTIERRQAVLAAVLSGRVSPSKIALNMPVAGLATPHLASQAVAPFRQVESRQLMLAEQAQQFTEHRYTTAADRLRRLGIKPERLVGRQPAVGGPFEPVPASEATPEARADAQFRSLFQTWKKLDSLEHSVIAIPAIHPVHEAHLVFSSYFGVRTDPFNGRAAMHAGVDIPGPVGTPVYATANGIVDRAGRDGGYGNMVEINHGKGIQTRYGHLSKILVSTNERVKRGELIALMGSTGRSTGSHLHYEVRIDGHAVNPMPFLQSADYLVAMQDQAAKTQKVAMANVPESDD